MPVTLAILQEHLGLDKVAELEQAGQWPPSEFDLQILTIPFADLNQHPNQILASILQSYVDYANRDQVKP